MARRKSTIGANMEEMFKVQAGQREISGLLMVERARIRTLPQIRKNFDQASLDEMRESVHELRTRGLGIDGTGLLQPLLVSPDTEKAEAGETGYFILETGERRYRSTDGLLDELPCVVVPSNQKARRIVQLMENLQRVEPSVLEYADALKQLQLDEELSVRELAALTGKGKGWIELHMAPSVWPKDLRDLIEVNPKALSAAVEIKGTKSPLRAELIQAAADGESVAKIRARIARAVEALAQAPEPADSQAQVLAASRPASTATPVSSQGVGMDVARSVTTNSVQASAQSSAQQTHTTHTPGSPPSTITVTTQAPANGSPSAATRVATTAAPLSDHARQLLQGLSEQVSAFKHQLSFINTDAQAIAAADEEAAKAQAHEAVLDLADWMEGALIGMRRVHSQK
jgi:ParB/RepB/Spo0J family partition protein